MGDPIDPDLERREGERRRAPRRQADRRVRAKLPVSAGPATSVEERSGAAVFAAQLIGQEGAKRGLRAGPPVLEEARAAYLEAEWMGPGDRRRRAGRAAKTEI